MFKRETSTDDAWEGIVTGKKRSSPDGQNMSRRITVTRAGGGQRAVRVRRAWWNELNDGNLLVKRAGQKYPAAA